MLLSEVDRSIDKKISIEIPRLKERGRKTFIAPYFSYFSSSFGSSFFLLYCCYLQRRRKRREKIIVSEIEETNCYDLNTSIFVVVWEKRILIRSRLCNNICYVLKKEHFSSTQTMCSIYIVFSMIIWNWIYVKKMEKKHPRERIERINVVFSLA